MEYSFKMAGAQLGRHTHLRPRELSPFLSVTQQVLDVRFDPRTRASALPVRQRPALQVPLNVTP